MQDSRRWRFGPIEVDVGAHRLARDGRAVAVTHKAFSLLVTLLRRPGELVTKPELFEQVWPGVVVSDAALSQAIRELRVALGDNAISPRYIATVHGLGFRFIAPVSSGTTPAAGEPGTNAETLLVGREAELELLESALSAANSGQRQVAFITGEAGIGKTALVEQFIERHRVDDDLLVVQGRCVEQYGPCEAHLPILEALEHLALRVGETDFFDAFSRFAPSWLAHLPWLVQGAAATTEAGRTAGETTRQRMMRELAHALDVLASTRTIVLWLEDLHWSDPSSLEVIAFIAGRRDVARLLLIGSFRPADLEGTSSALRGIALRLAQRGQAREIALRLLNPGDIRRYLSVRLGGAGGLSIDEFASFIHRRTEGNALFAVSMIDDLVRRGELTEDGGRWRLRDGVATLENRLPDTLRRLVHEQIERLSSDDRRLVEAAAVAGTTFGAVAVAAALLADPADVEDRCARLAIQGRLFEAQLPVHWPDGTASAGFRFMHALFWQGVNERVPEGRRAEWQRLIGLRQELAWGEQCAAIASELAMRFESAHDIARTLRYRQMAGAAALSHCAYPESIDQLRRGLDLVDAMPAQDRPRLELDLLLPLGAALMAAQGYASSDVEAVYRRALALCELCGQPDDLTRALRGQWNVAFLQADLSAARAVAERLLAQAESLQHARLTMDAHTKLGQTCLHQGDLSSAKRHLEAALASPVASDDRAGQREAPRIAIYLAWALWYRGEPAKAASLADTALDLARRADSPHSTAFALGYGSWVRLMRGEIERAQDLVLQQFTLSREYGLSFWRQLADFISGAVMWRQGKVTSGISVMQQAIEEMRASGGKVGVPYLHCIVAEAQLAAGMTDEARAAVDTASTLMAGTGNALYAAEVQRIEGLIALARDRGAGGRRTAQRRFRAALAIARQQGARAFELRAALSLAELAARVGNLRRARGILTPVRAGFCEGFETEDLVRADRLLGA